MLQCGEEGSSERLANESTIEGLFIKSILSSVYYRVGVIVAKDPAIALPISYSATN